MLEAIKIGENITGEKFNYKYSEIPRIGDHVWYVSDLTKFKKDYPNWKINYNVESIMDEIYTKNINRWSSKGLSLIHI
mgnify:FL=1